MESASSSLSERYALGELLGSGGSASVFAAVDSVTGAAVALKILHPHLSERPAARDAFLAEARKAEGLRHPNIVGVLGVGVDESTGSTLAWIALERAAGTSLAEYVVKNGALSPGEATIVLDGVLRALEAAHDIGLIHRDVSPANVMVALDESGRIDIDGVRLLDFGLADASGAAALGTDDLLSVEATGRAGVLGNVNYISPEQVRGEPIDQRGDIYQAGGLLHFALTGRPPFHRSSPGQTMRAHLDAPPPVPSVSDARIPRALDRVIVRAMLKGPADRFPSAAQMREAVIEATREAAAIPVPTGDATALSPTTLDEWPVGDDPGTTRILGRTVVTPRAQTIRAPGETAAPDGSRHVVAPARSRSRAGTWFVGITAAIVAAMVISVAATTAPTATVESTQTSPPPASQPATAPPSEPTAEPAPATAVDPVFSVTTVPGLGQQTLTEAMRSLADAGLTAGDVTYVDSPFPRDTVVESRPAAGESIGAGGAVAVTVASGFNTIPEVAGQGHDAAFATVHAAGFAPSLAQRPASGSEVAQIFGTDPAAGTRLPVGTPISVLESVRTGPTPEPSQPTGAPSPPSVPDPGR